MSGGVDSSVCAAVLKKNGYDVVGVFMRMHEKSNPIEAKKVAQKLEIPFKVMDVSKEFKKRVINYFIREYKIGNTPNPCVQCNPQIKFKFLMDLAAKLKADWIATGHYARIVREIRNSKFEIRKLFVARDKTKDQSYFLWQLTQKQLAKIIFPLGDYTKKEVRGLAKKWKLPVHEKESQDICFSNTNINEFLQIRINTNKGPITTKDGKKIGEHKGLIFYTIGQRKGLPATSVSCLAWRAGVPIYVVRKDIKKNALVVSSNEKDLLQKEMSVKNLNWLSGKPYSGKCKIKIRSMAPMVPCSVFKIQNSKFKIIFLKPQRAITPGQSAVFYKNKEVLGGGVII